MTIPIYYKRRQRKMPFLLGVFMFYIVALLLLFAFNASSRSLFKSEQASPFNPNNNSLPPSPPINRTTTGSDPNSISADGMEIEWELKEGSAEVTVDNSNGDVNIEATISPEDSGNASLNVESLSKDDEDLRVRNNINTKIDTGGNSTEDLDENDLGSINSGEGSIDIFINNLGGTNTD